MRRTESTTRKRPLLALLILTLSAVLLAPNAPAAAAPTPPELQFGSYSTVNAKRFQSLRYTDEGNYFFQAGKWLCTISRPGSVACQGRPATAPPNVKGVAITNSLQGPLWVPPNTTFRFGSRAGFRAPVLKVGQKIVANDVRCGVSRKNVVACATNTRGFILSPRWHKFYYPAGDRRHSANPPARYLPAYLR